MPYPNISSRAGAASRRAGAARWQSAADLLRLVRGQPGITRSVAAQTLGLTSGSATEITARLRNLDLLEERAAQPSGRGRPTTTLHAGPGGPLVAVVNIRHEDWQIAVVDLEGAVTDLRQERHPGKSPAGIIARLRTVLDEVRLTHHPRIQAISVAVIGTVREGRLAQASTLGWHEVDLAGLQTESAPALPLLIGNDATLAGLAEARRGAAHTAGTVLYLTIEVGIGGVLICGEKPVTGTNGTGGEFGHLPFGDPDLACPCGARGCWDLEVDGRAMARHRGQKPPADPWTYAENTLAEAAGDVEGGVEGGVSARVAVERCAAALGRGTAGLVNALAPDAVVLGGFAAALLRLVPDILVASYTSGLMSFRRGSPPPLRAAALGLRAPVVGATEVAFDDFLTGAGLADWSSSTSSSRAAPGDRV